ncbi:hypothetical protein MHYP_G00253950, partial [Metynnis hypsauchen]
TAQRRGHRGREGNLTEQAHRRLTSSAAADSSELNRITQHPLSFSVAMASAGVSSLCVALWLTGLILSSNLTVSSGELAVDCCLSVSNHPIPRDLLVGYRVQLKGEGCLIDAVLFQTKKNKVLCAPPDSLWVKQRKNYLECRKNGFKEKHCKAMKPRSA